MRAHPISRRRLLVGTGAAAGTVATYALGIEPRWLEVARHEVPVPGLPRGLDGFRVAQLTDVHLKGLGGLEESIVQTIDGADAQLVVLTGDIVDAAAGVEPLRELCRALGRSGRQIIATLGNWEHWAEVSLSDLAETYRQAGASLLVNDSLMVHSAVRVVATDDSTGGVVRLDDALRRREAAAVSLLLTHSPELLDRLPPGVGRFDLSLAGHTHGGQVRAGSLAALPPGSGRFMSGWYDVPVGRAYVSRGTGLSVVPARLGCRPELPIFTLRQG